MDKRLSEDFPVEWEDDHFVTRREFFKFLTLASGGMAVGTAALAAYAQVPREEIQFEPARICSEEDLAPGTALAFTYPRPNDLCLLVRRKDGEYVGFTRRCTHLSCPVNYEPGGQGAPERLFCPCHNGAFSVEDGKVLQGPPPHPIPRVRVEVKDGEVWAMGIVKGHHE